VQKYKEYLISARKIGVNHGKLQLFVRACI